MLVSYLPPSVTSLSEIDIAEGVTYSGESTVIKGVVSPKLQGGWPGEDGHFEIHCFNLTAWRLEGQAIFRQKLTVLRPMPTDYEGYFDDFPHCSIHQFRVLLSTDRERCILEEVLVAESFDPELQAIAEELRTPVVIATKLFGELTLNRNYNWFEGRAKWNRRAIDVRFSSDGNQPLQGVLESATAFWADQTQRKKAIEAQIVEELLDLKNEDWLDEDESPVTAREFIRKLTPVSITFLDNQEWTISYDDGDLFAGHYIAVSGSNTGDTMHVSLSG